MNYRLLPLLCITSFFFNPVPAQDVDGGNGHSIVLDERGRVWTIGRNDHGQLGNGSYENTSVPTQVTGVPKIKSIARGYDHTLAVDTAGHVWSWGRNNYGQLGHNNFQDQPTPQKLLEQTGFESVEGGYWHTVGLKEDGSVWAWGHNYYGELGSSNQEHSDHPITVLYQDQAGKFGELTGIHTIKTVGYHTLALDSHGHIWSWGDNTSYQLGHSDVGIQTHAMLVEHIPGMAQIAVGWHHSLALDSAGNLWTWGTDQSLMRKKERKFIQTPTRLKDLPQMTQIACGSWHSLAIDEAGELWAWGRNLEGMLGTGDTMPLATPTKVPNLHGLCKIGAGCFQSLAVDSGGQVWGFGGNVSGQLGLFNEIEQKEAQQSLLSIQTGIDTEKLERIQTEQASLSEVSTKGKWPIRISLGWLLAISVLANLFLLGWIWRIR